MKEMMELTQNRDEIPVQPLHVQLLSHPYMGSLSLRGAPAQFGPSFDNISAVREKRTFLIGYSTFLTRYLKCYGLKITQLKTGFTIFRWTTQKMKGFRVIPSKRKSSIFKIFRVRQWKIVFVSRINARFFRFFWCKTVRVLVLLFHNCI